MKFMRTGRAAVVAAFSALLLAVSQAPASAAPSGWHNLDNFQTGQDVFISEGRGVTLSRLSVPAHLFAFIQKEGGYYEVVQNDAVWKCLDSNHQGQAYGLGCNGGDYQRWRVEDLGSRWIDRIQRNTNVYRLVNKATGRCLDANYDGALYTFPCNGGNYQMWYHVRPWQ
ncbi:RICIN domain-containing protein [Streptomyces sp. NPDC004539]|uniref:RICIN domain-containing protein n=1 Tax=Streptomyces sp. NPDC004539 TaxID=3154280 RepID=UPI0033ABA13C